MGINLGANISNSSMDEVRRKNNPPEYEQGFGIDDDNDIMIFDDNDNSFNFGGNNNNNDSLTDLFGSQSDNSWLNVGTQGNSNETDIFGQPVNLSNQFNSNVAVPESKDNFDKILEASGIAMASTYTLVKEMVKSLKLRTADDIGYLSRNYLVTSVSLIALSITMGLIGLITGWNIFSFSKMPLQLLLGSTLLAGTGLVGLGATSKYKLKNNGVESQINYDSMQDASNISSEDDLSNFFDSAIDEELDNFFDDDDIIVLDDDEDEDDSDFKFDIKSLEKIEETKKIDNTTNDFDDKLKGIIEHTYITREILFETFKRFLPLSTPSFCERTEISRNSEDFEYLETICMKALSNVLDCDITEVNSSLYSAEETYFSYILKLQRVRSLKRVDTLCIEIENYVKETASDTSKKATGGIVGDFYVITITKGESAIITLGDIFKDEKNCKEFLDTSNKLPFVVGIDNLGNVEIADAKNFDTMMITGKPRSGKSWYVLNCLMNFMMFNLPDDVQFIIVDPKKSNIFKTLALMPHVIGLSDSSNILDILNDIIDNEGERRKKLLSDNKCDNIWELREKGIKLPMLYVFIDEVITIKSKLLELGLDKEFDNKLQVLISQLPYVGIRLIFVPHRATGIVNKTNRTMLQFTAAIRAEIAEVIDTLGIKKWDIPLTKKGDMAVKYGQDPLFLRGPAVTPSDDQNALLIRVVAKAFYKMGVDLGDRPNLQVAYNRDDDYIKEELMDEQRYVQYNANNINLDDEDEQFDNRSFNKESFNTDSFNTDSFDNNSFDTELESFFD